MIGRLFGNLVMRRPDEVLLDVGGVGYQLQIPLSTFYRLADASGPVALHVHTHVREDAIQLFGFWTAEEKSAFQRLIAVSGIGPKIALAVLSGIGVADLNHALKEEDRGVLERIPGIGRKTAERVILELRERPAARKRGREPVPLPRGASSEEGGDDPTAVDAASALVHLGYSEEAAQRAVAAARREVPEDGSLETLLRASLRTLVR